MYSLSVFNFFILIIKTEKIFFYFFFHSRTVISDDMAGKSGLCRKRQATPSNRIRIDFAMSLGKNPKFNGQYVNFFSCTFRVQEYTIFSTPFFANGVVAKPSNSLLLLRLCA